MAKWLVYISAFILLLFFLKRFFILGDPVKTYIKKHYDPHRVHIHFFDPEGVTSKARFYGMHIDIVGANKLQDLADYGSQKRFEEEMELLSKAIIEIVIKENRLNFDRLEFSITSKTSGWNPNGSRTKLYIYDVDEYE